VPRPLNRNLLKVGVGLRSSQALDEVLDQREVPWLQRFYACFFALLACAFDDHIARAAVGLWPPGGAQLIACALEGGLFVFLCQLRLDLAFKRTERLWPSRDDVLDLEDVVAHRDRDRAAEHVRVRGEDRAAELCFLLAGDDPGEDAAVQAAGILDRVVARHGGKALPGVKRAPGGRDRAL